MKLKKLKELGLEVRKISGSDCLGINTETSYIYLKDSKLTRNMSGRNPHKLEAEEQGAFFNALAGSKACLSAGNSELALDLPLDATEEDVVEGVKAINELVAMVPYKSNTSDQSKLWNKF